MTVWLILIGLFMASQLLFRSDKQVAYTEFLQRLDNAEFKEVVIGADRLIGTPKVEDQPQIYTFKVEDDQLIEKLKANEIPFKGVPDTSFWSQLLIWVFPFLFLFWILRRGTAGLGQGLFSMGKSTAKVYMQEDVAVTFKDVAGIESAKEELTEIVEFLKAPERYSRLGGRMPKGVLLVGPPGTGKTLLAKAVAGEAGVPFYSINGSEFVELFVGMGASRVRDLFKQARERSPSIIFIDELDALGKARATGPYPSGASDEKEQTLNQLLAEVDGFDSKSGVVLLAATNRPEVLDPALLRAGRFDRQVLVDNPDSTGRFEILKIHGQKVKLAEDADLHEIALMTSGFSGADLANLVNEAALMATRRNAEAVTLADFETAVERIVAGLERKQRIANAEEKKQIAYHEMGHATLALAAPNASQILQKVSIVPRGLGALGYTLQRPVEDRYLITKQELEQQVAMLLAGRASEEIFCGKVSTGAGDDLVKATNIVRAMVLQYGMSQSLGLMSVDANQPVFLSDAGRASSALTPISEKRMEQVDREVQEVLTKCFEGAKAVIEEHRGFIETSVERLLDVEVLGAEELQKLWAEA
jgi:cell division protease FtsH